MHKTGLSSNSTPSIHPSPCVDRGVKTSQGRKGPRMTLVDQKIPINDRNVECCDSQVCEGKLEELEKKYNNLVETIEDRLDNQYLKYNEDRASDKVVRSLYNNLHDQKIDDLKEEYDRIIKALKENVLSQALEIDRIKQDQALAEAKLNQCSADLIRGIACVCVAYNGIRIIETFGTCVFNSEEKMQILSKLGAIVVECMKEIVILSIGFYCYKISFFSEYSIINKKGRKLICLVVEKIKQSYVIIESLISIIGEKMKVLFLFLKTTGSKYSYAIGFAIFCIYLACNKANIIENIELFVKWRNGEEMDYPLEWYSEYECKS